jgi:RAD50-interacting protein 1
VDALIANTRSSTDVHLHSAQEMSLLRHSIADEASCLSEELVSSASGGEMHPTLLEDLETLHHSLKEMEILKGYMRVIEHTLKLRSV